MPNKPTIAELVASLDELKTIVSTGLVAINERVDAITDKMAKTEPAPVVQAPASVVPETSGMPESRHPIPTDYRLIVDATLNKGFGINVEGMSDKPAFLFTIIVPEKYSSLTVEQKKIMGADIRPKVIGFAEGVNGVREWAERVFTSFNQDMRSLIVSDRVQGL